MESNLLFNNEILPQNKSRLATPHILQYDMMKVKKISGNFDR